LETIPPIQNIPANKRIDDQKMPGFGPQKHNFSAGLPQSKHIYLQ
jgi:hypothetical protein